MTVGVYGLVGGIVKLDDAGLYLSRRSSAGFRWLGQGLLRLAPWLMKALSLAGTGAMFLVGGGILMHGILAMHHVLGAAAQAAAGVPEIGGVLSVLVPLALDGIAGILGGALVLAAVTVVKAGMRAAAVGALGRVAGYPCRSAGLYALGRPATHQTAVWGWLLNRLYP